MRSNIIKAINKSKKGFTIIELIVVIVIIGILTTIVVVSYGSWKQSTVTAQLKSDLSGAVSAMEDYRNYNNRYPDDINLLTTFAKSSGVTLSGGSSDGKNYCVTAISDQDSNLIFHSDNIHGIQTGICLDTFRLNVIANTGGTVSAGGLYDVGSEPTITASPDTYYEFQGWSGSEGCVGDNSISHTILIDSDKTCTANFVPIPINTPLAPVLSESTVGSTTTFSWNAVSCPGNTARYQYRYTISPSGYDSGLIATSLTSVPFTTSTEAQTYTVSTQAQCYNTANSSDWSTAGSVSYYRLITVIADTFNRTASSLGSTSTTNIAWTALSGTWSTNGTKAVTTAAVSTNPSAVVDFTHSDVDASVDISSSGGGDSLIIRATDSSNYIRARYYHTSSTAAAYCTIGSWVFQGTVYTEGTTPGETIPGYDKIGGSCLPYDEWPGVNGDGAAQTYTYVTSTHVTCDLPYVWGECHTGNRYARTVIDNPAVTTHQYYVYIERMSGGVLTNLSSSTIASAVSKIRLKAQGSTITLYVNGSGTSTTSLTNSFNQTATKHGIGRGTAGDYSTSSIDNLSLTRP